MRSAIPIPWPAALGGAALAGLIIGRGDGTAPDLSALVSASALVLLALLVQFRLRETAGNRWAADASTAALALGSPLLLAAEASSSLPASALLLYSGFMIAGPTSAGGSVRILAAGILFASAIVLSPLVAPAAAALCVWAVAVSSHRGGPMFGGGFAPAAQRLFLLLPGLLAATIALLPSSLLSWAPAELFDVFEKTWPRPCGCAAVVASPAASPGLSIPPYLAAPWLFLAIPGLAFVLRRFELRREAMACVLVLVAQSGAAAWFVFGGSGSTLFAGSAAGEALTETVAWGRDGWAALQAAMTPALPFALIFVAGLMSWLRNRPALAGPRMAGLAAGPVIAAIGFNSAIIIHRGAGVSLAGLLALVGSAAACSLTIALLFPGGASVRGRLTAAGLALAATVPLAFLVYLYG